MMKDSRKVRRKVVHFKTSCPIYDDDKDVDGGDEQQCQQDQHDDDDNTEVQPTLHLNDYTVDEIVACWYNQSEYQTMKDEMIQHIYTVRKLGVPLDQMSMMDRIDCRGLECRLDRTEIRRRMEGAIDAVMDAQDYGGSDEDIRERYYVYSAISHVHAHMCGVLDQFAMSLYLNGTGSMDQLSSSSSPLLCNNKRISVCWMKSSSSSPVLASRSRKLRRSTSGSGPNSLPTTTSRGVRVQEQQQRNHVTGSRLHTL